MAHTCGPCASDFLVSLAFTSSDADIVCDLWSGIIAYTSFEEPTRQSSSQYIDIYSSDADHELPNSIGYNPVKYTACSNGLGELGFRSFYQNTARSPAAGPLFLGTAQIGVIGDTTTTALGGGGGVAPDGAHFYMLTGATGFVYVELDMTSVSAYTGNALSQLRFSCWVHVESTSWEADDQLKVWADVYTPVGVNEAHLISGINLDDLPGVVENSWKDYEATVSAYQTMFVSMKFGLQANKLSEEVWVDYYRLEGTGLHAPAPVAAHFTAGCDSLFRLGCSSVSSQCGSCLTGFTDVGGNDPTVACQLDCSDTPVCTSVNRGACLTVPFTCGPCLAGFVSSVQGDSNVPCGEFKGAIAYTSFEEPPIPSAGLGYEHTFATECRDICAETVGAGFTMCPSTDMCIPFHYPLVNANPAMQNVVQHNSCESFPDYGSTVYYVGAELGFSTYYTYASVGTFAKNYVGVVGASDMMFLAADGENYFSLEASGGFVYVALESVQIGAYSSVSVAGYLLYTGAMGLNSWADDDEVLVWAELDGVATTTMVDPRPTQVTPLRNWIQYGAPVDTTLGPDELVVKFGLRSSGTTAQVWFDRFEVLGVGPRVFDCTAQRRCRFTSTTQGECGACLYGTNRGTDGTGTAGDGNDECDVAVNCGAYEIPNAVTDGESFYGGTGATSVCIANYTLRGSATRICQADGAWDVAAPECLWDPLQAIPDFERNCSTFEGRVVMVRIPWEYEFEHQFNLSRPIGETLVVPVAAHEPLTLTNTTCTTVCKAGTSTDDDLDPTTGCARCNQQCRNHDCNAWGLPGGSAGTECVDSGCIDYDARYHSRGYNVVNCAYGADSFAGCHEDEMFPGAGLCTPNYIAPGLYTCTQVAGWYGMDCDCSCLDLANDDVHSGSGWHSLEQALLDYRQEVQCALYPDQSCNLTVAEEADYSDSSSWDDSDSGSWQPEVPPVLPTEAFVLMPLADGTWWANGSTVAAQPLGISVVGTPSEAAVTRVIVAAGHQCSGTASDLLCEMQDDVCGIVGMARCGDACVVPGAKKPNCVEYYDAVTRISGRSFYELDPGLSLVEIEAGCFRGCTFSAAHDDYVLTLENVSATFFNETDALLLDPPLQTSGSWTLDVKINTGDFVGERWHTLVSDRSGAYRIAISPAKELVAFVADDPYLSGVFMDTINADESIHRLTVVFDTTGLEIYIDQNLARSHVELPSRMAGWQTIFSIGNLLAIPDREPSCVPRDSCPTCSELGPQFTRCHNTTACVPFGESFADPCADGLGDSFVTCSLPAYNPVSEPWGSLFDLVIYLEALEYDQVQLLGLQTNETMMGYQNETMQNGTIEWISTVYSSLPPMSFGCVPLTTDPFAPERENVTTPRSSWYWDSALHCNGTAMPAVQAMVVGDPGIGQGPTLFDEYTLVFDDDDAVLLRPPLQFESGWTADMWVELPLPAAEGADTTLFTGADGGRVFVSSGSQLAFEAGAQTVAADVNVTEMQAGWHRLTIVVGDQWALIYRDAEPAVATNTLLESSIESIGNDPLVTTPECALIPLGVSDGRIKDEQVHMWNAARTTNQSTGRCGTRHSATMEDYFIGMSQPQCSLDAGRMHNSESLPDGSCGWCPQVGNYDAPDAAGAAIEVDLGAVTSISGVSTRGSPTMHTTYVKAGMTIRLRMPDTDYYIGRPKGEDANTKWLGRWEAAELEFRNRTYMHLFTAPNYDTGCFTDSTDRSCWSSGTSDSTELESGDVVVWFFSAFAELTDCAGYTCGTAPYPVQDNQWGSPFKILKSDGTTGRIAVGETVYFQRLGRVLDEHWGDNNFVDCSFDKCSGTQNGVRDDFQICMSPEDTTRDPCGGAEGLAAPMSGGADDIGQWVTSYSIDYSVDGNAWRQYEQPVLEGNTDFDTVVTNRLEPPLVARWVRITPLTWQDYPILQFELHTCNTGTIYSYDSDVRADMNFSLLACPSAGAQPDYDPLNPLVLGSAACTLPKKQAYELCSELPTCIGVASCDDENATECEYWRGNATTVTARGLANVASLQGPPWAVGEENAWLIRGAGTDQDPYRYVRAAYYGTQPYQLLGEPDPFANPNTSLASWSGKSKLVASRRLGNPAGKLADVAFYPKAFSSREVRSLHALWFSGCNSSFEFEVEFGLHSGSDRKCANVTWCGGSQWELLAPNSTRDRICTNVTGCIATEYEFRPPMDTHERYIYKVFTRDRICSALTVCNETIEYEIGVPNATTDRICTPLTVCTKDSQWESLPPNTTRDRQCTDLTACNATQYESIAPAYESDRGCTALTACSANGAEAVAPTVTTDRECECNVGWWGDGVVCWPWTVCEDVERMESGPTPIRDRSCVNLTVCDSWQYESSGSTAVTDRVCTDTTACDVSPDCADPVLPPDSVCAPRTACHDPCGDALGGDFVLCGSGQCVPHKQCYESCREGLGDSFVRCWAGSWLEPVVVRADCDPVGMESCGDKCVPVGTASDARFYVAVEATTYSDLTCIAATPCSDAAYESTRLTRQADRTCTMMSVCDPNAIEVVFPALRDSARISDRDCECSPGYWGNGMSCTAWTVCGWNWFHIVVANATVDRVCQEVDACDVNATQTASPGPYRNRACQCDAGLWGDGFECSEWTDCDPNGNAVEFEAPTSVVDRVCMCNQDFFGDGYSCIPTLGECQGYTWESAAPTTSTHRVCLAQSLCDPKAHEIGEPTYNTDRACSCNSEPESVCTPRTACYDPCGDVLGADLVMCSSGECVPRDQCFDMCTATVGEAFVRCWAGSWLDEPAIPVERPLWGYFGDGVACQPWKQCGLNAPETRSGNATVDRLCACSPGFWSPDGGELGDGCIPWTICPGNSSVAQSGTRFADVACTCDVGYFDPTGRDQLHACGDTGVDPICGAVGMHGHEGSCVVDNNICLEWYECVAGEYEVATPSLSSDRVCSNWTECTAWQYEARGGNILRDRECVNMTVCTATAYESVAATDYSNRGCSNITVCTPGEYESAAPTATADRDCQALSVCSLDALETRAHNATSDRVCECYGGHWGNGTQCNEWSTCAATQYMARPPKSTVDRDCVHLTVCSGIQFQARAANATHDRVCRELRVCSSTTQFETVAPTQQSDRECTNLTVCDTTSERVAINATATSDRSCKCEHGFWTNGSTCVAWQQCVPGVQYSIQKPNINRTRVCALLTVCDNSTEYELVAPTATSNRLCARLIECTYQVQVAVGKLNIQWESLSPNATRDRQCTDLTICDASQYESTTPTQTVDRACTALTECSEDGAEVVAPTTLSDRECECDAGWWGDGVKCGPWTACDDTQLVRVVPNSTVDRECEQLIQDCSGVWGGVSVTDQCGVCAGDGIDCVDCAGMLWGNSRVDPNCGACTDDPTTYCEQDCKGVWGGTATTDVCNVCGAYTPTCLDCSGLPFGTKVLDAHCGLMWGDGVGPITGGIIFDCIEPAAICEQDCAGAWGGSSATDNCLVCDGADECFDCAGVAFGDYVEDSNCGGCVAKKDVCDPDCSGAWGGSATVDKCEVCGGGNADTSTCKKVESSIAFPGGFSRPCYLIIYWLAQSLTDGDELKILGIDANTSACTENRRALQAVDEPFVISFTIAMAEETAPPTASDIGTELSALAQVAVTATDPIVLVLDCFGVAGGNATNDICGVCGGTNSSCVDCAGVAFGNSSVDPHCSHATYGCSESHCTQDCFGVWGSPAVYDQCGVCAGVDTCVDCAGIVRGGHITDPKCGNCTVAADVCKTDCAGLWGGPSVVDSCNVCGGSDECLDCAGVVYGPSYLNPCEQCVNETSASCTQDCLGVWGGSATDAICRDRTPPSILTVSISASRQPLAIGGELSLSFTASEDLSSTTVTFSGQPATGVTGSGTSWQASYVVAEFDPDGAVSFIVDYSDLGHNAGTQVVATTDGSEVVADTIRPDAAIVQMRSTTTDPVGVGGEVTVYFVSTEPLGIGIMAWMQNAPATVRCDNDRSTCNTTHAVQPNDIDGPVAFSLYLVDLAGNTGEQLITTLTDGLPIPIDLTAPSLSVSIESAGASRVSVSSVVTLSFNSTEALDVASIAVRIAGTPAVAVCDHSGVVCSATVTVRPDMPEGLVTFSISYRDTAQNRGPLAISTTDGTLLEADVTQPSLGMVSMTSSSSNADVVGVGQTLTIRFVASEPLGDGSRILIAGNANITLMCDATRIVCTGTHTVTAATPEGPAEFSITIVDVAGNPGMGDFGGITGGSVLDIDTTPPSITLATVASDDSNTTHAAVGSRVALELRYTEAVRIPSVEITGRPAQVSCTAEVCRATVVVTQSDPGGMIVFAVSGVTDLAGNPGNSTNHTTDSTTVYLEAYVALPEPEPEPEPEPLPILAASAVISRPSIISRAVMLQDLLYKMQASHADTAMVHYEVQANGSVAWPRAVPDGNATASVLAAFETALAAAAGMPEDRVSATLPRRDLVTFTVTYDSPSMAETLQRDNFLGTLLGALGSAGAIPGWVWSGAVAGTVSFQTVAEFSLSVQTIFGDDPDEIQRELGILAYRLEQDTNFGQPLVDISDLQVDGSVYAWVATPFSRCERTCGPRQDATRSLVCTVDGVGSADDECVQTKPPSARACPILSEGSACDDGNDETTGDSCESLEAGSCAGKIALVSTVTFDIAVDQVNSTLSTAEEVNSSPVALAVKPALATALTAGGMSCSAEDITVLSIVVGSLVVDYKVVVPPALATPDIKAAASAAVTDPASVGLPVNTMAITVSTTDASGNVISVTSSNTPIAEAFRSYSYVMVAGSCPAAGCNATCGALALSVQDSYTCQEDGMVVFGTHAPCITTLGAVPESTTECCPAADPDACQPPLPPAPEPEPEPVLEAEISVSDDGSGNALFSDSSGSGVIIAVLVLAGACLCALLGGLRVIRDRRRKASKIDPKNTSFAVSTSFNGDASKLAVSSKYNLAPPAGGKGKPVSDELGLRSASYSEKLPALLMPSGLRSASVRDVGGGGQHGDRRGSNENEPGGLLSNSFKQDLQMARSVGGGSFEGTVGNVSSTIGEGDEGEEDETPRDQQGKLLADTFNTRLGRFRSFMKDLDEGQEEDPRIGGVGSASFGEANSRLRADNGRGNPGGRGGLRSGTFSEGVRGDKQQPMKLAKVVGIMSASFDEQRRQRDRVGSGGSARSVGRGSDRSAGSSGVATGIALLQSASFTAGLQKERRTGLRSSSFAEGMGGNSSGRKAERVLSGSFDEKIKARRRGGVAGSGRSSLRTLKSLSFDEDDPKVRAAAAVLSEEDDEDKAPHPMSAGSAMWGTTRAKSALLSSSFGERAGKSGEEMPSIRSASMREARRELQAIPTTTSRRISETLLCVFRCGTELLAHAVIRGAKG